MTAYIKLSFCNHTLFPAWDEISSKLSLARCIYCQRRFSYWGHCWALLPFSLSPNKALLPHSSHGSKVIFSVFPESWQLVPSLIHIRDLYFQKSAWNNDVPVRKSKTIPLRISNDCVYNNPSMTSLRWQPCSCIGLRIRSSIGFLLVTPRRL